MAQYPSDTSASGRWTLKDQYIAKRGENWPGLLAQVELLIVAGGGGGSYVRSNSVDNGTGGGGAGGLLYYGTETPKTSNAKTSLG